MAQHKDFACPACGAEFETREQLDNHNQKEHQHSAPKGSQQGSPSSGSADRGQSPGSSSGSQSR
jgi:hypothetical protein